MSNFITKLENYGDLEVSIIRSTKINKVLKALFKLNTIPKDEEFNFRSRSVELLARWNKALGAESTADDNAGPSGVDKEEQPTTNGVHKVYQGSSEEKKGGPTGTTQTAEGAETSPETPVEAKGTVAENTVDDDAPSTGVTQEADGLTEGVKADAGLAGPETS